MNALSTIHRSANTEAAMLAIKESSVRADAGISTPASATESIAMTPNFFHELTAAARAAAAHHLNIANAKRYFNDRDAGQAITEAERFANLVEEQALAVARVPEIVILLADLAFEPDIRRNQGATVPDWTEALSARARSILTSLRG